jgi:alkanesulfonate monooxygenase SsuD/methylene tetrahydromethanopterin reductase-like flavin-dependent oxidoreductase (luciferase family)
MGAGSATTATFAQEVALVRRLLAEADRDPASIDIGKRVYVAVDADRDRAGRRLAEYFGGFYGRSQLAAEVSVWGSVDQVVAGLRDVIAAGAGLVMLNPVFDEVEQLEILAAEVVPRL